MQRTKEEILLDLIQGDEATSWAQHHGGWSMTSDACIWRGIGCDQGGKITSIELPMVSIKGTLPSDLGVFNRLMVLNLYGNDFVGTIPDEILRLPDLAVFNVGRSQLQGGFPRFWSNTLDYLDLNGNLFSGVLPYDLDRNYPNLATLDLGNNTLTGTLSTGLGSLGKLDRLVLGYNKFIGTIPLTIAYLTELHTLALQGNQLIGTIPPAFGNPASKLTQIFLESNNLSGTIPASLADLPNLQDLFIGGNKLTGTVPAELCHRDLNALYFNGIPGSESRDPCESIACPVNSKSDFGVWPCSFCQHERFIPYLGHTGQCLVVHEKHIMDTLYLETSGPSWIGAERWNNPNIPVCMYEGVDCNLDGFIVNVSLPGMNLVGPLTNKLGRLRHLRHLDLRDNFLTGEVPSDLRFPDLDVLLLGGNRLVGPLAPMLCESGGINKNGVSGDFSCDTIVCSPGTYHPDGHADAEASSKCKPCPGAVRKNVVGARSCSFGDLVSMDGFDQAHFAHQFQAYQVVAGVAAAFVILGLFYLGRRRRRMRINPNTDTSGPLQEPQSFYRVESFTDSQGIVKDDELDVVSYDAPAPPLQQSLSAPPTAPTLHDSGESVVRRARSRDNSPEDPDAHDLWLDVPKIA